MKIWLIKILFVATVFGDWHCFSQGFVDLNFENAVITPDPSSPYYPTAVYASNAIPGWTATGFIGPSDVFYNTTSQGSPVVSILGVNGVPTALDGAYSVELYGGDGNPAGTSISQAGLVSAGTASIQFIAQGDEPPAGTLLVSLGGQNISLFAISTGPKYTLYGGNIPSGLAGNSEQLMFTAAQGYFWEVDDIQFSPQAVPEPGVAGLLSLGGLLFGLSRCKKIV